jgi:hypothetical protein
MRRAWGTVVCGCGLACALAASAWAANPIPEGPGAGSLTEFIGSPATANPVPFDEPPRHPFMAPNGRSNLHVDGFQTDVNSWVGPLGRGMTRASNFFAHECASVAFDSRGRIVTLCVGLEAPVLQLLDPNTLDVLAQMPFPPRQIQLTGSPNPFTNFSGGGYFYLDDKDRAVAPTTTRHIWVVKETDTPGFETERDYDVSGVVPLGDSIISALPDWSGRIWFASTGGVVGTIDPAGGAVKAIATGEPIGNSFAVGDNGGVYIVSDVAMYRFDAGPDGTPKATWREVYPNDGVKKSGQSQAGSGTTPTLIGSDLVAITDNADPVDILVYKRAATIDGPRLVCKQAVFEKGKSSTDQSLVATQTSIVTENNFGYAGPQSTEQGGTVEGGVERVDLDPRGGCHKVWHNDAKAPTSVPKLSAGNGLVYVWTKPEGDADAWYLTAIDFRTGKTVYSRLAGEGLGFNNNYAPVTIGPDGSVYMGVLGGIVRLADATPPTAPGQGRAPAKSRGAKPRLALRLRYRRSARGCALGPVTASVVGRDARSLDRVDFSAAGDRRRDDRAPFRQRLAPRRRGIQRIRARAHLDDGRTRVLTRRVRICAAAAARPRFVG